jgi:Flp pilus assembly pilin Flp
VRRYVSAHSAEAPSRFDDNAQVASGDADLLAVTWFNSIPVRLITGFRRPVSEQDGQALIEYALIVSLIALIAIASLKLTGTNISSILNKIAGEV